MGAQGHLHGFLNLWLLGLEGLLLRKGLDHGLDLRLLIVVWVAAEDGGGLLLGCDSGLLREGYESGLALRFGLLLGLGHTVEQFEGHAYLVYPLD